MGSYRFLRSEVLVDLYFLSEIDQNQMENGLNKLKQKKRRWAALGSKQYW